ncbi:MULTISPECIES: YheT family hydrolase [Acinetobacter]|uniref:Alpha/beta fold hydrolase n=1 Tax=Acinetobacter pecorum TaxID=2762215 RepID=A0ABR8VV49_9GAMM|nr:MULTISPECIES: alpha/beta fold hydrolase [Acinetobacter]MBD8008658.1 alpha/beta fold hydrolase [Acinetobacter pecorum]OAL77017.1 alpha/beta hydrolase [Acinetobacter sp. SFA]OAL86359.1 alpha/beta hydrolase [Acinetobacter sp. SFD]
MKMLLKKMGQLSSEYLDRFSGADQPTLYYNPNGIFSGLIEYLPQLKQKYRPTPWLANAHAHILYLDLIKKRTIKLRYDLLEQLKMSDGGITGIAWYGLDLPANTPTIVLLHTITGSPESMRELVRDLHKYTGWRVALCLRRGHAHLPMPVPKMNLFGSTQDLREQLLYIQDKFPQSDLYGVGSSAGTGLLVRYLGEEGEQTPLKAAFALCPGYDMETGFDYVHPFYSKVMTKKLIKRFIQPYQETWQVCPSWKRLLEVKDLSEFERLYFELAGFKDYVSYTQATNPIYVFENVKIPLMILNSEDDPVCNIRNLEPHKDKIRAMPNIVVITTKRGSHCGFYQGLMQTESWATRLMADYLIHLSRTQVQASA